MNHKPEAGPSEETPEEDSEIKVDDRRHWMQDADEDGEPVEESAPAKPTIVGEYLERAELAEQKLHEYIGAYKHFRDEQEQVRLRLNRDVERKAELRFGELVAELLMSVDDLDRALEHVGDDQSVRTLADGVRLVRRKFIETLERHGVERMEPDGEIFDPNLAEAIRVDPVDDDELNDRVTETLRPGYRLGERVLRAAQVAVGRRK
jgi:molecular chaperone GrpE